MQFGVFYEHQLPRPWGEESEHRLLKEALDQVQLADRLGIEYAWEVEHHFLEEYSHSSAPEVFLAACSQRTKRIRLGHGIVLMPSSFNHPARVAERLATLDLISDGRVEWGTGSASSRSELEGFGVDPGQKHLMWEEAVREAAKMMVMHPYAGFSGQSFAMPARNVVPKPLQKPHPPLWLACSNRETIKIAARYGMGALTFAFVDPASAAHWVEEYYETFERECRPIGRAVNPNIAIVAGFMLHEDAAEAARRGARNFQFFGYALSHFYISGSHLPGNFNLWDDFQRNMPQKTEPAAGIGTPDQVRSNLEALEDAGVDQVVFVQQAGNNRHEHICESLELFAERLLPAFKKRDEVHRQRKAERLAPAIERAMDHLSKLPEIEQPSPMDAYPLQEAKAGLAEEPQRPVDGDNIVTAIAGRG